jgi:hypothetical protein
MHAPLNLGAQRTMYAMLATLLNRLDTAQSDTRVIGWGSPVPSFGDPANCRVASLGLNPSDREFVDQNGAELHGPARRFHTLGSLELTSWADANGRHLWLIRESCQLYFQRNPYDRWFRRLDAVVSSTQSSFYDADQPACHLDLVPFATSRKWTDLNSKERGDLVTMAGDTLAGLLRMSTIRVLILNGMSVVRQFERVAGTVLRAAEMPRWSLPRPTGTDVIGLSYFGVVDEVAGTCIGRPILVLGYNHNLQSSFGVTNAVVAEISNWVGRCSSDWLNETP